MKHVGILGGSFNPVHIGHLIIAQNALEQFNLDKILLIPNKYNPFKSNKSEQDINACIDMLNIIKNDNSAFEIDLIETKDNKKNYTYDTVKNLVAQNPDSQYYFIVGSDILEKIQEWYKIEDLFQLIPFIIVKRPGYPIDYNKLKKFQHDYNANFLIYNGPNIDISSTTIRNKIYLNESIKYLTPDKIIDYINKHKLYLKPIREIDNIKEDLKETLKPKRYEHSLNVMDTAIELAKRFDVDVQKAELAGLLHDCAKSLKMDEMIQLAEENDFEIPNEFLESPSTIHAIIGQLIAQTKYNINDSEILSAIAKHTTGSKDMSQLDKIIFLADYIEPLRTQPGVDEVRKIAEQDLDKAVFKSLDNNLNYLNENNVPINRFTEEAWKTFKENE